ncbi:hypothetical protein DY000_02029182 [Brassica cretica]|uniref:DUF4005 domain-containing protein n=1 Tax=Brassica cretica TaxID=69181 RepID=A0ABQ7DV25_BRACR|nr:hypothetical protein DY000_02029182 [Brassica cretica]
MRSANPSAKSYWRPISGDGAGGLSNSVQSQVSHTPSPKTQREPMIIDKNMPLTSPQMPEDSGRLQEVNIQYLEYAPPYQTPPELMRPFGSKTTGLGSAQNQRGGNESPIRTLSKKPTRPPSTRAPAARRVIRSPAQGVSLNKR